MQEPPHPVAEANEEGLAEPQLGANALYVLRSRELPGHDGRRVSGREIQQPEDEQRHEAHHRDRDQEAPDDVGAHGGYASADFMVK